MQTWVIRSCLFAIAILGVSATAADAFQAIPPCNEVRARAIKPANEVYAAMLIRPKKGTSCRVNMFLGDANVMLLDHKIIEKPRSGRFTEFSRNSFVYEAGSSNDIFVVGFRVRNKHGEGWMNVEVQARPR